MDVDLLRPGTVPISPDTVLWFEFLLDEKLLSKHLCKENADPSPASLINKFTSVNLESLNPDLKFYEVASNEGKINENESKRRALKLISLKVVAHMNWNLDFFLTLPFKVQVTLMEDLFYFTGGRQDLDLYSLIKSLLNESSLSKQLLFALTFYHRWVIKTATGYTSCTTHSNNFSNGDVYASEDSSFYSAENVKQSIQFLVDALNWETCPYFLNSDCFSLTTKTTINWDLSPDIVKEEFCMQICYDIAVYYFYEENYEGAYFYFKTCLDNMKNSSNVGFANVEKDVLESYLRACKGDNKDDSGDLLQQMYICVYNQYMGILNVLQKDNVMKAIPSYSRINLELNVREALLSGKFTVARDFLPKMQSLNVIRFVLHRQPVHQYDLIGIIDAFIWALSNVNNCTEEDKKLLRTFICKHFIKDGNAEVLEKLLRDKHVEKELNLKNNPALKMDKQVLTGNLIYDFSEIFKKEDPILEKHLLEQAVVKCYDPQKLKNLINQSPMGNTNKPVWKLNSCWALPIPLQSVLASMPKGQQQDYSYVLLIKSRELALARNWTTALELLEVLKAETKTGSSGNSSKLICLINWEILLIKINQLLEEWPGTLDHMELAEECIKCLQMGGSILPRTEIMERCILCLINLKYWDFLSGLEKRWTYIEIAVALANACQNLVQYKGNKKFSRDIWELVLPVFVSSNAQSKRSSSGNLAALQRNDSGNKAVLISVFSYLRDPTVLNIVISMLTRMYNILKDESTVELTVELTGLWPAVISNATSYSTRAVSETLYQVLKTALRFHPNNIGWLRLSGDLNYSNAYFGNSLRLYLNVLALSTDYFSTIVRTDDQMIKRVLKSCFNLGCHTQGSVLSQFLDDPDYMQAFHSLSEQKFCNDAADSYYHCFWDTSILEYLIHVHHKRSEFQRRRRAIQVIGLLELNSNNNQEIQQESNSTRKNAFLRALYQHFMDLV